MTLLDSPAVASRFDQVCKAIAAERRGLTLTDLGHAHRLAQELEAEEPDEDRVEDLVAKLDVDVEALR